MTSSRAGSGRSARFAVFSAVAGEFTIIKRWVQEAGHEVALVVTQPNRQGLEVAASADPETVVVVSRRPGDCRAILEEAGLDAGIICAFPKVPMSLVEKTRHGIVNLHPALLPEYPGPNPLRALYEGERRLGFTLHRIAEELDAGPILAQAAFEVPAPLDPDTFWSPYSGALAAVLEEGIPKVLADDPGISQRQGSGTFARAFTEAEEELPWELPARLLEARMTALLRSGHQPRALLEGRPQPIRRLRTLVGLEAGQIGVLHLNGRRALVGVADGVVEVDLGELPFG